MKQCMRMDDWLLQLRFSLCPAHAEKRCVRVRRGFVRS